MDDRRVLPNSRVLLLVSLVLLTILACDGTGVSVDFSKQIDTWTKIGSVPAGVVPPWIQEPDGSKPVGLPGKVSVTGLAPQEAKGKQAVIYLSNSRNPEAPRQEEGRGVVGDDLHWKLATPVQLVPGQNFLHATVLNDNGQPGAFSTVAVCYDDGTKASSCAMDFSLTIESPADGSVVYAPKPEISGTAKPGVRVAISSRSAGTAPSATSTAGAAQPQSTVTDAWGKWTYQLPLAEGSWTITAQTTGVSKPETASITISKLDKIDVPYLSQLEQIDGKGKWAGWDNCGPTSVAMAMAKVRNDPSLATLDFMHKLALQMQGRVYGTGPSDYTGPDQWKAVLGSDAFKTPYHDVSDWAGITNAIDSGLPVVAAVNNGEFKPMPYPPNSGLAPAPHAVVVTGYTDTSVYFNDPLACDPHGQCPNPDGKNWRVDINSFLDALRKAPNAADGHYIALAIGG